MPFLLICIQTVSSAYRQASSAYAQWDSESTFRSGPPGPSQPSAGIPVKGGPLPLRPPSGSGSFCFQKAAHPLQLLSHLLCPCPALPSFLPSSSILSQRLLRQPPFQARGPPVWAEGSPQSLAASPIPDPQHPQDKEVVKTDALAGGWADPQQLPSR